MKAPDIGNKIVYKNKLYSGYHKKIIKHNNNLYQRLGWQVRSGEDRLFSRELIKIIIDKYPEQHLTKDVKEIN